MGFGLFVSSKQSSPRCLMWVVVGSHFQNNENRIRSHYREFLFGFVKRWNVSVSDGICNVLGLLTFPFSFDDLWIVCWDVQLFFCLLLGCRMLDKLSWIILRLVCFYNSIWIFGFEYLKCTHINVLHIIVFKDSSILIHLYNRKNIYKYPSAYKTVNFISLENINNS